MATIKPFRGIRPPQNLVEQVASRPYDVLNSAEAREEAAGNEKSLYHIIKPEIDFPIGTDEHDERVYQKAAENFRMFQDKGWLVQDDKENYYVYAQTMNGKTQYGLVVGAYVPDYMNGVIKKHELTRRDKEEDRMKHVRVNNANIEPVFFAYPDNATLDAVIARYTAQKPVYDFIAPGDGFGHTFWIIDKQEDIDVITKEFGKMPALYIADGHHRAASAVKVGLKRRAENPGYTGEEPFNYFLSVLFPDEELMILPYNRVVKDLNGMSREQFFEGVKGKFELEEIGKEPYAPAEKGTFGMYLDNTWYALKVLPQYRSTDPVKGLDVSILQDQLLGPVLGIGDPRTDKRIDFIGGIRGLKELERRVREDMEIAFSMYPTSIEELLAVADAGLLMPPKSTWFEPKLRSGLFIHKLS